MTTDAAAVTKALAFMMAQVGHAQYSEQLNLRLGPTHYDCSGLVYEAFKHAGILLPPSDDVASTEANFLGTQPGVQVIKSPNEVKTGDVLFFTGAAPDPSNYGPIGHVGMATSSSQYVSAYDTQEGVAINPISGDNFVVAMRLTNANISPTTGGNTGGGGGSGILGIPQEITTFFSDANGFVNKLLWLAKPASWLRIGAFLIGVGLLMFGIHALIAVGEGSPIFQMPQTLPIPVPL